MPRRQLNLRLDEGLHERLAQRAAADGCSVSDLCRAWILSGLEASSEASGSPSVALSGDRLADRLAMVEERLAAIEERLAGGDQEQKPQPAHPSGRGAGVTPAREREITRSSHAGRGAAASTPGDLTARQLAQRLKLAPSGVTAWANRNPTGSVHPSGWRLIGKVAADRGGPPRWMFAPPGC